LANAQSEGSTMPERRPPFRIVLAVGAALLAAACDKAPSGMRPLDEPGAPATPAASPALPGPSGAPKAGAWVTIGGQRKAVRFLCDGLDRPQIIAVLDADAEGHSALAVYDKAKPGAPAVKSIVVGDADPGAGQIYYPLSRDGAEIGALHTFNPGALDDPAAATLPTLLSVKLGEQTTRCRWVPRARLLGFTAKRSLLVSATTTGGLAYTTFDFRNAPRAAVIESGPAQTSAPSLDIETGTQDAAPGPAVMRFDNEGYGYAVRVGADGAEVAVSLGGAPIQTEPLIGYAYAP
jgi:hypothetical protein